MFINFVKSLLMSLAVVGAILLIAFESRSEEMNVPQDELAKETVYPVFDNPVSVKNRNVKDSHTFDIGIFGGLAITEPIANTSKFGVDINYHFNEVHSLGLQWGKNSNGLSKDAEGLRNDFGLDFTRAPFPEYSLMGDYNYKMYYGKLSVTKNGVINTSIFTSASAGIIKYIHKSYPAISVGVGERFYITNSLALKVDLRLYVNQAPIPFKSGALRTGIDPVPDYGSFSERVTYTTNLEVGINHLF